MEFSEVMALAVDSIRNSGTDSRFEIGEAVKAKKQNGADTIIGPWLQPVGADTRDERLFPF